MLFRRTSPFLGLVLSVPASLFQTTSPAHADENPFGYSEGAETQPAGHVEVSQWLTQRSGKMDGRYDATDSLTEIEYGVTDRLQTSLYLSWAHYGVGGVSGLRDAHFTGFSGIRLAGEYALRNPDKDGYGLAVYAEPEYSTIDDASGARVEEYALEAKLIYQKEFRRETVLYLANLTAEPEVVREQGETNHELTLEFSHGISVRVAPGWSAGIENRWRAEFEPWRLTRCSTYAGYLGPTIHYEAKRWWITAAWQRQAMGWPENRHGLALDEFERNEVRLKFGIEF